MLVLLFSLPSFLPSHFSTSPNCLLISLKLLFISIHSNPIQQSNSLLYFITPTFVPMGFPFICSYRIIMPKPIDGLLDLWSYLKFLIRLALFYLGLFDPTDPTNAVAVAAATYNPGVLPRRLPQLQVLSPHAPLISTTPDSIKEQLPIMNFAEFSTRAGTIHGKNNDNDCDDDSEEEEEATTCVVCLCSLEGHHQVRKLGNCNHVFHMGCLDSWVDLGQVTCPLCRSLLVPREGMDGKAGKDSSWVVERISYLFSEDLVSHWTDYHH